MSRPPANAVQGAAVIGGGVIGASWAGIFHAWGMAVVVVEPHLNPADLHTRITATADQLTQFGLVPPKARQPVQIVAQVDAALAGVDLVQECAPEKLALKRDLIAQLDAVIRPEVVICSSTSSLLATNMQAESRYPGRVVVAHPFNPPHLLPLVEVVAGQQTDPAAVDWAMDFYRAIGKYPVRVKKEAIGHIGNRLTAALYREAVHIVAAGIGTVEDVDAVITQGPGLRWSVVGPHLTYHLSGGPGGIEHYLEHLGPTQEHRWDDLGQPRLTNAVKAELVRQIHALAGERTVDDLARERDAQLVAWLKLRQRPDDLPIPIPPPTDQGTTDV